MSVTILHGDALVKLRELPDASVHCCITSPPYWGLRDYGVDSQIWDGSDSCAHVWGDEQRLTVGRNDENPEDLQRRFETYGTGRPKARTQNNPHQSTSGSFCQHCQAWRGSLGHETHPQFYIAHLVQVFAEVKRILRNDGTAWIVIGDSYSSGNRVGHGTRVGYKQHTNRGMNGSHDPTRAPQPEGLREKNLIGIPWRLAFALQDAGWILRQEITWCKSSAMPESVKDRPSSATEKIFLFAKQAHYFYDQEGCRHPIADTTLSRNQYARAHPKGWHTDAVPISGGERDDGAVRGSQSGANLRNFWLLGPEPLREAHFAAFPTEIPRRCILLGTSARGCCSACRAPWVRVVEKGLSSWEARKANGHDPHGYHVGDQTDHIAGNACTRRAAPDGKGEGGLGWVATKTTIGWRPSCTCYAGVIPCTILDPFSGSGTTLVVADRLGRHATGIELSAVYVAMMKQRLTRDSPLFMELTGD
jgi:DNA modification methylase